MNPSDDFIYGPNDYGELNGHCQSCNLHFGFVAELKLHFATIHQRQSFECVVCNKLFLQKFNFLAHIDRVHQPHNQDLGGQNNRDKKNYSCLYCDRFMVLNSQTLQAYIHKEISLICPMCQQPIPSAHSSKKNLALKKLERHPYDCTVCHKSFKSPSSLAFHNKSSHQDTMYKCPTCGKSFSRPSNVERHIETVHTKTKTFPCKFCDKDFKSTGGRDMHIHADHQGISFNCDICGKEFTRKGSLDRHVQGVHQEGIISTFKCSVCLTEFKQKSHLKKHLKNVHRQDMDSQAVYDLPTQVPIHNSLYKENPPASVQSFSHSVFGKNNSLFKENPPASASSHLKKHLKNVHHQDMDSQAGSDLPTQVPINNSLYKENPPASSAASVQTFSHSVFGKNYCLLK